MNYTLLIYEDLDVFATVRTDPKKRLPYHNGWMKYRQALVEAGVLVGGAGLQAPDTGSTVRLRGNKGRVQDGPYADTKEQLGGYWVIDVPDLETAQHWAQRCLAEAGGAAIEVRPNLLPPAQ
jgi:hypothetical protein